MHSLERYLIIFAVLASAGLPRAGAIEITQGPHARAIGVGQTLVTWTTDVPGDTRMDYGPDWTFGTTWYDAAPTSSHSVVLGLPPGTIVCYKASSSDGATTAALWDWHVVPTELAEIRRPAGYESLVTGTNIQITGMVNEIHAACQSADFIVTYVPTGQQTYIGTDIDGTEWMIKMGGPEIYGDGWSAYWNTASFQEGEYDLLAVLHTDMGPVQAQRRVYWDPAPPFPKIDSPGFARFVSGTVPISGGPIDAETCNFFKNGLDPGVPEEKRYTPFPTVPLKQRDFVIDGKGGTTMCEPTAEAAALWARFDEATKDKVRKLPAPNGHACMDSPDPDACAKTRLVEYLAKKKGTLRNDGTKDSGERTGTKKILDFLGLDWTYNNYDNVGYGQLKQFAFFTPGVKAIVLHVAWPGKENGHSVALMEIDNMEIDGKHKVKFMDPDTGEPVEVDMDKDGKFEYPKGRTPPAEGRLRSVGVWADRSGGGRAPKSVSLAQDQEWILIGTDTNPTDGISASWDTTGLAPGFYWIRAEAVDSIGHTGEDLVEVIIAATPAGLSDVKSLPDNTPVAVTDRVVTNVFGDSFWIEEDNRVSGIRVARTSDAVAPGDRVSILGAVVTHGLEREIQPSQLTVVSNGNPVPKPLGMTNRSVGGGDSGYDPGPPATGQVGATDHHGLNNVGLLVTIFGQALSTGTDPEYGPYAVIGDGSVSPPGSSQIRVYTSGSVLPGEFRIFRGNVGLYLDTDSKVKGAVYEYGCCPS